MDYEKKYKEALERMRYVVIEPKNENMLQAIKETVFPELAESKDEKTRKRIIALVNAHGQGMYKDDMLAWLENIPYTIDHEKREGFHLGYKAGLEKQGEQKPTLRERYKNIAKSEWFKKTHEGMSVSDDEKVDNVNKIEPKFKVGDWITDGQLTCKVLGITDKSYELHLYNDDYCHFETDVQSVDKHYHLWTIQDAKPGDIIAEEPIKGYSSPFVALYKKIDEECDFESYCFVGFDDKFYEGEQGHTTDNLHPATKEQRDLLFQKMKEVDYEWDAEKKELKKFDFSKPIKYNSNPPSIVKEPAWTEDDENILNDMKDTIKECWNGDTRDILLDWFETIKQRIKGNEL